jgi:hypothetical protein
MSSIKDIINEEILTTVANFPEFGNRLGSISETGEGNTTPYSFKFENTSFNEVHYYFNTETYEYDVIMTNSDIRGGIWDMQFGIIDGTPSDITNEGKVLRIMSTIVRITDDFIKNFKPNILKFKPEKDKKRHDDKRRFNLYMQFLKKNIIPMYFIHEYGEYILIERKVKIKSNIPKI